jgi:hypothetical protein
MPEVAPRMGRARSMGGSAVRPNPTIGEHRGSDIELDPHPDTLHPAAQPDRDARAAGGIVDLLASRRLVAALPNMKELRPGSTGRTGIRVLFAFDRKRKATLLVGGDKSDDWRGWYDRNVPTADARFDEH